MRLWSKLVTAVAVGCASLVVPAAPAMSAPPDYVVTGDACQNHSYYFMGWAHVESDCLSINASTLGDDKGRADLTGVGGGGELHVSLALDCLVVEQHSATGHRVFAAGLDASGTRYALTLTTGKGSYWAGSPTGTAPCNAYDVTDQALTSGGFAATPLSAETNVLPTADFTHACDGYTCTFDASPSFDPDGELVEYRWQIFQWGTPVGGSGSTFTYTFHCRCYWDVRLTVVDEDGGAADVTKTVLSGASTPYASFSFDCQQLSCAFDASASSDPDGSIQSYRWDFGDGVVESSSLPTTSHTYESGGSYYVYLTVTDSQGLTATRAALVDLDLPFELFAESRHQGKRTKVQLTWTGSYTERVDIYRDGSLVATVDAASGSWSEQLPRLTSTVTYKICDLGSSRCSNEATVSP